MPRLVPARLLAALRPDPTLPLELAGDSAREARRRVRIAATLGALGYAVFLMVELLRLTGGTSLERSIDLTHDVIGTSLCGLLFVVAVRRSIGDRRVLALALAAQVVLACVISVAVPWAGFIRTGHLSSLTWVVPIMILFPLLVPAPPRTAWVVTVLCALTLPGGVWLLSARGLVVAQSGDFWHSWATAGVAAGIATVASRTVHGARQQAAAARRVGSYELIERLGRGGMGEVWKARHLLLARPAAIKLILPEALQGPMEARDAVIGRFTREAQVTASLRSPHTVELFDFGVTAEGTFYYAMELLEGTNLEHFVYQFGPLGARRAVHWLRQACHSLGEAHARGLVHRDVKPANLFVCRYGRDVDFVKVLDFGLTRPLPAAPDETLSGASGRMGTPGYMAPEQVLGHAGDPRTDLYALGCVGYWLLAGEKPFEAESVGELLRQHAQAAPPALSRRAGGPIPDRLEALVMACLAKDPSDRPRSADQLSMDLGSCLEGPPWSEAEAQEWWSSNLREG